MPLAQVIVIPLFVHIYVEINHEPYTTYISIDLACYEIVHAKAGKDGITYINRV